MNIPKSKTSRRKFISQSATTAAGLAIGTKALGVPLINTKTEGEKIRMGFIGIGNRGTQLLHNFLRNEDVELVALCDVYEPYVERDLSKVPEAVRSSGRVPAMGEGYGEKVKRYADFRKLLEDKEVDAVCIATPDHWHAIQTIQAIEAGKDVYVEKPLTITLKEGRAMIDAEKKSDRIVQVGLNRRGSTIYRSLAGKVEDKIGKVTFAKAFRTSNMYPNGIGNQRAVEPPAGFNWDMWLGPRAYRPYQYNIAPYYFRWWKEYSSQMGNWGVHYMDTIRWMVGETAPMAVSATGGKYVLDDDRNIPDTMDVIFEFKSGMMINFGIHEASSTSGVQGGEIELSGTKGNITISQNSYHVAPSRPGQFQEWKKLTEEQNRKIESGEKFGDLDISEDSTGRLIRNFLDCIKSRQKPWCKLEDGHRSTSFAHLANIALEVGQRIEWDPVKEEITNNKKANDLLSYEYRSPWKLS